MGPFLVSCDAWKGFFASHPQLTGFLITESPRFDLSCMESLASNCPNLADLRLSRVSKTSDEFLEHIAKFDHLNSLELSYPEKSLGTEATVELLDKIGSRLTHLDLSGNVLLSDDVLTNGLVSNIKILTSLSLGDLPDLTDKAMRDFFVKTQNVAMQKIWMRRNFELSDEALEGLLAHSGRSLIELDINSWKSLSNDTLLTIGERAPHLIKLDIGWCRNADDFVVKAILDGCPDIIDISVFGCNKLTENCPRKVGELQFMPIIVCQRFLFSRQEQAFEATRRKGTPLRHKLVFRFHCSPSFVCAPGLFLVSSPSLSSC